MTLFESADGGDDTGKERFDGADMDGSIRTLLARCVAAPSRDTGFAAEDALAPLLLPVRAGRSRAAEAVNASWDRVSSCGARRVVETVSCDACFDADCSTFTPSRVACVTTEAATRAAEAADSTGSFESLDSECCGAACAGSKLDAEDVEDAGCDSRT